MGDGLATTFRVLTKTANEAAVRVLIPALDSPQESIQHAALAALLRRRSPAGGREILRRLHTVPEDWMQIIRQHRGRLARALRDAVLGTERQTCLNACRAAVWFHEYDLIATLLNVSEDQTAENADVAAETVLELAGQLYDELAGPRDDTHHRDPQFVRQHMLAGLESSVQRFGRHQRREVIEAFLLLVGRENVTLKRILQDPHHASFLVLIDVLSHGGHGGVIRLLLSFLDDPRVPSAALSVVGKRGDLEFVQHLLRNVGREPSLAVKRNLKRIVSISWLRCEEPLLDQLDDDAQHAAVQLVMAAGIPRQHAFSTIEHLLLHGRPGGRRAAAAALAEFQGADANALALRALEDADPQVQANILAHLRRRGIPGILPRLVEMVDVPHAAVRNAVREALEEFSFQRFLGAFDMLDDEVRYSTGMLVKKIDPQTLPLLEAELESPVRTRRLRGLRVAEVLDAVGEFEPLIIELLDDKDHLVRAEAAAALAQGNTGTSCHALEMALGDRSATVQEAARKSLGKRTPFTRWREALSDPRD